MMDLQRYIDENGLNSEIISSNAPTSTVEETMKALNCGAEDIIKSIVIVTDMKEYYLVILQGNRRIKTKKLKKLLMAKDVHLASPSEVIKITGYNVGDVPPISINLAVIIDELVLNKRLLYAGGGEQSKNLYLSVNELIDCTHPLIADISVPL
jgi:prolyl-tRNA editing enzyme YbaK/EbsC (Cys-tRNA(Pro) deacylase)